MKVLVNLASGSPRLPERYRLECPHCRGAVTVSRSGGAWSFI